jgi:glutathione S-transferase
VPRGEADQLWAHQIQLTIADFVAEVHDLHHPIGCGLYYEDQKAEALRRAQDFRSHRLPKFMAWFEAILQRNPRSSGRDVPHLVGGRLSYVDLSLFQVVEGLVYALPKATRRVLKKTPLVVALHASVPRNRRVAAYLASDRRLPFSEQGIFRSYPELDA